MTVLRITQEALLNIVRHAQADRVAVSLHCEDDALYLKIEDNGVGFASPTERTDSYGHGLMIMRERAEAVGGTLEIASAPGQGTRIEASLPIHGKSILVPKDEIK
jgi:signal transduction histidine kinase